MHVIQFKTFVGDLQIQQPVADDTPSESPVLVVFTEKEDLTKHEILRRFRNLLSKHDIDWIRPLKEITSEWVIDLRDLKSQFKQLEHTQYLKGKITIEPEYRQQTRFQDYTDDIESIETSIKFKIYPEELQHQIAHLDTGIPEDLAISLQRFNKDHPKPQQCGFLMMKYEDTPLQKELVRIIGDVFAEHGCKILRADEKWYSDDLLPNIKTYMHGCGFGVALFERINNNYFNPNVSLEIGYMMSLRKPLLYLKERTLSSLQSDLIGKLYSEFDFQYAQPTLKIAIDKWWTNFE